MVKTPMQERVNRLADFVTKNKTTFALAMAEVGSCGACTIHKEKLAASASGGSDLAA